MDYFRLNEAEPLRHRRLNDLARKVAEGGTSGGVYVLVEIGGGSVELRELSISSTEPSSPETGDLWVDIS